MKRIIPGLLILILCGQLTYAQRDSVEYIRRPFQFTFMFPPLSTNGIDNVNIVNDISLNLFLGVSGGVGMFEAGSFINIDRFFVEGIQLAGFGNSVGGYLTGAQLSGFYNVTGTHAYGLQGAGFVNVTGAGMTGVQSAGFANVTGQDFTGVQGAGFVNVAGAEVKGVQAAGFLNIAGGALNGLQGAGFLNICDHTKNGVQAAGFGNVAGAGNNYFQGAGFFNVADEVNGAQLAGFINVAGKVKGTQLSGFINVCDSIDGIPLSFISVVKQNGYRKFGFTVSEVQYANLTYKMGVRRLYNIYSFGKPFGPGGRWLYGGGLGTEIDLNEKMMLNIEGTVHQELWIGNAATPHFLYIDRLNLYNSVKFLFGWNMENQVALHVGPTLNLSVANSNPDFGVLDYRPISPYAMFDHTSNNYRQTNLRMWIGVQGSVSF